MKRYNYTLGAILLALFFSTSVEAQSKLPAIKTLPIEPSHLSIAFNKTSTLIFPYSIVSVDRGSKTILAQKAKGSENILQVKAGNAGFEETNLTVITSDGNVYPFIVDYEENPSLLTIQCSKEIITNTVPDKVNAISNEAVLKQDALLIRSQKRTIKNERDKKFGMKILLDNLFINQNILYLQISISNKTEINYDIDQLRFYIKDKKRPKRTASQELELKPLYIDNKSGTIKGSDQQEYVVALPKFTLPDKKQLTIELMEKNGGRHLHVTFGNNTIIRTRSLSDIFINDNQ